MAVAPPSPHLLYASVCMHLPQIHCCCRRRMPLPEDVSFSWVFPTCKVCLKWHQAGFTLSHGLP
uniref:Uncharacterized protein n=1 Tax=Anguilla anguilla TaxID=7936 RepID=A0A0E9XJ96_ANGAN